MKKFIVIVLGIVLALGSSAQAGGAKKDFKDLTIAFVPKLTNQPWFQRMEVGVKNWSKDNGINVIWKGPTEMDPAAQVQIITDLVAQQVDILCVVPLDPNACEPILKKAMDQGIIVVTHEASTQQNTMYYIEAFKANEYGAFIMDTLAGEMGGTGKYITMVASVTSASHMDWADAGVARQKAKYPNMQLIEADGRVESKADAEVAYQVAKEMIKKYPDLRGIMGTSSFDAMGCARAIKELGLVGKVFTAGSGIPSENAGLLKEGILKAVTLWDPRDTAYAMLNLSKLIYEGKPIQSGIDLGVDGYHNMSLSGKVLEGKGWVTITAENVDSFGF